MTRRRDFIKKSVLGSAGIAIGGIGFPASSYRSITGSNDRINVAVVGLRGRGTTHVDEWCGLKESHNVRLVTICDVDEQFYAGRSKTILDKTGVKVTTEWDMHKVLQDPRYSCCLICYTESLACNGNHLGLPGRETCVC